MSLVDQFLKGKNNKRYIDKIKEEVHYYDTGVYGLNLALSGDMTKGATKGIVCLAGKSKSFKTLIGLICAKAHMDADKNCYMVFYDSEGGASEAYFDSVGIDKDRVIYVPIMNIEELKFDISEKLEAIKTEHDTGNTSYKFVFLIDSIGNLASVKEIDDALDKKIVADMSRAKALKSLTRIITPYFKQYNLALYAIMHTYDEIGGMGAPKQIMSGGNGFMLASDEVIIIGKRQIKNGTELAGWSFILNMEKSRTIREKSIIPLDVSYENGVDRYSGLLDMALLTGHVVKPKMGWYTRPGVPEDKNWRKAETSTPEFWDVLLSDDTFQDAVEELYSLSANPVIAQKVKDMVESVEET